MFLSRLVTQRQISIYGTCVAVACLISGKQALICPAIKSLVCTNPSWKLISVYFWWVGDISFCCECVCAACKPSIWIYVYVCESVCVCIYLLVCVCADAITVIEFGLSNPGAVKVWKRLLSPKRDCHCPSQHWWPCKETVWPCKEFRLTLSSPILRGNYYTSNIVW